MQDSPISNFFFRFRGRYPVLLCPPVTLPRLNWIQKITALVFVILLANSLSRAATSYFLGFGATALLVVAFIILLPFAMLPLIRRATWRVRNRLFVTYFLVGILPIFLIVLFVQMGFTLVLSQATNYLLHKELERRLEQVYSSAERQAQAALDGKSIDSVALDPGEAAVLRTHSKTSTTSGSPISAFPAWRAPGFKGVVRSRT